VLVDHATIDQVAGARPTMIGLMIVFGVATVTAVPALIWLYVLIQRPATRSH
jgi:cytochrome bd ubiquinol oxidase subunit II